MAKKRKTKTKSAAKKGARKTKRRKKKVKYSPLSVFDFEGVVDCVTRAGAS